MVKIDKQLFIPTSSSGDFDEDSEPAGRHIESDWQLSMLAALRRGDAPVR